MKTLVVQGVLESYSNGTWADGINIINFVVIDGKRYPKVVWSDYMENFIKTAVGKRVRISFAKMHGLHVVGAVDIDGVVEKETNKSIAAYSSLEVLARCVIATIFGGFLWNLARSEVMLWVVLLVVLPISLLIGRRARFRKMVNGLDV